MNFSIKDIEGNSHDIGQYEKDFILNNKNKQDDQEDNEIEKVKKEYENNENFNKISLIND